jgi:formate dehydrogenase subunit gamma
VPGLGNLLGNGVLTVSTISHRIFGVLFIVIPVISYIAKPSNVKHIVHNLFMRWDTDDKNFMKYFGFYLFNPKKYHMPKQQFVKSGQRMSDIVMYLIIIGIAVSGVLLMLGTTAIGYTWFSIALFIHKLTFMGMFILFWIHIYLGAGMFQPYRRISRVMFGDGYVSESDALYHWGHWAEAELASGENVKIVEKDIEPMKPH